MAEKTGSNHSWQPMLGAAYHRLRLLGELLRLRRAALGWRYAPAFTEDRDINTRMVGDIEHGRRDTYTLPTLQDIAAAYDVTYDSMMAVVWSDAGELVPAPAEADGLAPAAPPVPGEPPGWMAADKKRTAVNRPYRDRIMGRLDMLATQGITSPSGDELFGEGTRDAYDWDKYTADWEINDRVWFVADLQRRQVGRTPPNSGTGDPGA